MVLIPSLIDDQLSRPAIVKAFAKEVPTRQFGIVVLVPSSQRCADWGKYGARVVDKNSLDRAVEDLRKRSYSKPIVIANYYDGIDLPDNMCRILIIDSKPFAEELIDRYLEDRRQGSKLIAGRIARIVEQGMGRSVRGEKDYCVIVLIGSDLVRALQAPGQREFFSDQTRKQIQLGKDIAGFAKEEIEAGDDPMTAFRSIVNQCLQRNAGWKDWYVEQMNTMKKRSQPTSGELLSIFQTEISAEREFQGRGYDRAAEAIQKLIDQHEITHSDKGWYLQEKARYTYPSSKAQSNELQKNAHKTNHSLLRPKEGMIFSKVPTLSPQRRLDRIKKWLASHELFEAVATELDAILTRLSFGVIADRFEQALKDLACTLGFESDRPDKEWKEGPDNLWGLRDNQYLLFECKSEVDMNRAEINKREADQMNRSSAWFKRYYPGSTVTRVLIIPPIALAAGAALNDEVLIMRKKHLDHLTNNVRAFFNEFHKLDLRDLSSGKIEEHLRAHKLMVDDLTSAYGQKPKAYKAP
jgi:hypothetical protein